ncbi:hypothetical protein HZA57_03265, partial [Candidatus Poribacteria bacterium]|nr:hypothetical protein [Candidatus Poribacteria bacterium]
MKFNLLSALLVILLGTVVRAAPAPDPNGLLQLRYEADLPATIIEDNGDHFTFEVRNEHPTDPGSTPATAEWVRYVAIPPQSDVNYQIDEIEWLVLWQDGRIEGPFSREESSSAGPLPSGFSRAGGQPIDEFRSIGLAQCKFPMVQQFSEFRASSNPATVVVRRFRLTVRISGGRMAEPPSPGDLESRDPYMLHMARELVINPDMVARFSRDLAPPADIEDVLKWDHLLASAQGEGPVALFKIGVPGLYQITPRELSRLDLDPTLYNVSRMRVFLGNRELPILREPLIDGPFVGDIAITFYVPEPEHRRTPFQPVWLLQLPRGTEAEFGEPRNMTQEPIHSSRPDRFLDLATAKTEIFFPKEFEVRYPFTERTGRWAMASISQNNHERFPFEVEGLNPEKPAQITVSYGGMFPTDSHDAQLYVNDAPIGPVETFRGVGPVEKTYELPAGLLNEGVNQMTVAYPVGTASPQGLKLAVAWAEVTYPVRTDLIARGRVLTLGGPSRGPANVQMTRGANVRGVDIGPYMVDVTNPLEPVRKRHIPSVVRPGQAGFITDVTVENSPVSLYVCDADSVRFPGAAVPFKREEWFNYTKPVDMLIIANKAVEWGVGELRESHISDGLNVRQVDVDRLYGLFSFGYQSTDAIRDAIHCALAQWPGARMSKVLLAGEASEYWWEYRIPRQDVSPNQVPVYEWARPEADMKCDDGYVQICGKGGIPDLEIGRIPAGTGELAQDTTRRMIAWEKSPPAGTWSDRHVFISDDEPEFSRVAERIIGVSLRGADHPQRVYLQDFPFEDYFRIFSRKRSSEMTDRILDALSRGSLSACYLGHGGPNLWSAERIFHYRDIHELETGGRRPIMTAASCDTAWVDYPLEPVRQSLGETFLLAPGGGTIGVFAPVAGTSSFEHDYLLRPFYAALSKHEFDTLGSVTQYARMMYLLERNQPFVSGQFILLGDPALKIPKPSSRIALEISPSTLFADQREPLKIKGKTTNMEWGMAEVELLDLDRKSVAGPVRTRVMANEFELDMPLPAFLKPGSHTLQARVFNTTQGRSESLGYDLTVHDPEVHLAWTADPPVTSAIHAGEPVRIELAARNETQGYMDNVELKITEVTSNLDLTTQPLVLEPARDIRIPLKFSAPPGVSVLEAEINYLPRIAGQAPIASARIELLGQDASLPAVAIPPNLTEVTRAGAPPKTNFQITLYNMRDEPLVDFNAYLFLLDRPEGSQVGRVATGKLIPPRGKAVINFSEDTRFPEGTLPFRVDFEGEGAFSAEAVKQSAQLAIEVPRGTDIEIVPGSVAVERAGYVRGETVFVTGEVRNRGDSAVENLVTTLYVNSPWWDEAIAASQTGQFTVQFDKPLQPGETRPVRLRWDPPPSYAGKSTLYIVANADRKTVETSYTNNLEGVAVSFLRLPNLALREDAVRLSQHYIRRDDVVDVTLPYVNDSPYDFDHPFVVEIRARGAAVEDLTIYRTTIPQLDAGEEGLMQVAWRVDGVRDSLYVSINEDREYGESEIKDNTRVLDL